MKGESSEAKQPRKHKRGLVSGIVVAVVAVAGLAAYSGCSHGTRTTPTTVQTKR